MSEKENPGFLDRESDEYRRLAIRLAFGFCPPIKPCQDCGGPVISGYYCNRCGSSNP